MDVVFNLAFTSKTNLWKSYCFVEEKHRLLLEIIATTPAQWNQICCYTRVDRED